MNTNWNDSKKFWQQVNTLLPKNNSTSRIKLVNEDVPVPDKQVPDFINDYFSKIGPKLAEPMTEPWVYNGIRPNHTLPDIFTNVDEVKKLIGTIDTSKTSAITNLSSRIIKDAFESVPNLLIQIFNLSLSRGIVPDSWKAATVIPLKKEGNSPDVNNLRPISLLPIQIKMLEKVVHNRLFDYLENNDLLDNKQGGFRPNHSTVDTIVRFSENIYKNINSGKITIAVYIDLRKAFDTVNHDILLQKLELLGVDGTNLSWVKNYLQNRTQYTLVNNLCSSKAKVTCGVPQGSVLGPLLFLIYVNDMQNTLLYSKHFLYADDTVIFHTGLDVDDVVSTLQEDLDRYKKWCEGNKLTVNTKKSNFVVYGTRSKVSKQKNLKFELNGDDLIKVPYYKYLGVFLDSNLNFNKHLDVSKKLICHKLYMLSRIRKYIDEITATRIFQTIIAPLIDYGDIIYAGTTCKNLDKLQSLQNRGLRICINENDHFSINTLHSRCKIPKLLDRRIYNLRKYMFKQKNNMELVIQREIRTRRHDAIIFETCRPNLEKYKKGTIYRGVMEWNELDVNTRKIDTFDEFKKIQKKFMFEKTLENI